MSLPSKVVQFPFVGGADQGVDPRSARTGTLVSAKNVAWTKDGRLDKRHGTTPKTQARSDGGNVTTGKRIVVRGSEIAIIDGTTLLAYSPALNQWVPIGEVPELGLEWETLEIPFRGCQASDIGVTSDGKIICAFVSGEPTFPTGGLGVLTVEVLDATTHERISVLVQDTTGLASDPTDYCRVIVDGASWGVAYNVGTQIRYIRSDFTMVALITTGQMVPFGWTVFDACVNAPGKFVLAWEDSVGVFGLDFLLLSEFDVATGTATGVTSFVADANTGLRSISIHATAGESLYIAYGEGSASRVTMAIHDPATLAQVVAPFNLDTTAAQTCHHIGVTRFDATSAVVAWTHVDAVTNAAATTQTRLVTNAGAISAARRTDQTRLLCAPFMMGEKAYMLLADYVQLNDLWDAAGAQDVFVPPNNYLVEIGTTTLPVALSYAPHRLVGKLDVLTSGVWRDGHLPRVQAQSSTKSLAPVPSLTTSPKTPFLWGQGVKLATITSGASMPEDMWRSVVLDREPYISAACFSAYDGQRVFDYGFPRCTNIGFSTTIVAGPGFISAGVYQYAAVPHFRSAAGITHRGPSAPIVKITFAANLSVVTLKLYGQTVGWKGDLGSNIVPTAVPLQGAFTKLYRSIVNGETLHDLVMEPFDWSNVPILPQSVVDDKNDSDISDSIFVVPLAPRPLVYTTGELDDYAPPAVIHSHVHKDRLFVIVGDRRTVWYSKNQTEDPTLAPGFHPNAILVFDQRLVGLDTIDDKLIVYGDSAIWYVSGDGPAVNGDGSDYSPVRVQADTGCMNARSIVATPNGSMYQSRRGIYMLSRNLEVEWVGKPVQDTLALYPNITSAVLVDSLNQVRFSCNNDAESEGVVLVYDYVRGQWSVFEYSDGLTAKAPIADAAMVDGVYTFLTPGGKVYQEDSSTYLDDGVWVTLDIETSDVVPDGPMTFQRIRRAYLYGERFTDCDLRMRVAVDAATAYDQTRDWTSAEVAVVGANVGIHIRRQKAHAIRIRITDASPTGVGAVLGTGRGVNFSAVGFEIAGKQGLEKRRAEARK